MNIEEVRSTTFVGCVEQLSKVSKPVVATVNGLAAVGGCELVEMCDIVIAGQSAKFSHPEIALAAMPGAGGTQRLSRVVGKHIAMDMLLTGRPLSAQEALIAGLVRALCPMKNWSVRRGKSLKKLLLFQIQSHVGSKPASRKPRSDWIGVW